MDPLLSDEQRWCTQGLMSCMGSNPVPLTHRHSLVSDLFVITFLEAFFLLKHTALCFLFSLCTSCIFRCCPTFRSRTRGTFILVSASLSLDGLNLEASCCTQYVADIARVEADGRCFSEPDMFAWKDGWRDVPLRRAWLVPISAVTSHDVTRIPFLVRETAG